MQNIRALVITLLAISVPLLALNIVSNLPKAEPAIPATMKSAGFHGVDGVALERKLMNDSRLRFTGQPAIIACPKTLLMSDDVSGLCGYCKVSDFKVYPSWLDGFTMKLETADFDYRNFYVDQLHGRYVQRTNSSAELFDSFAADGWRESSGRWFTCRNQDELDVNAYIDVFWAAGELSYEIGAYEPLGPVRQQGFVSP
ncbi:MAG: hypothetical protein K9G66_03530 [Rhodoluna sp.]|nr:hypothetical protein [Rhodoluna sp.]